MGKVTAGGAAEPGSGQICGANGALVAPSLGEIRTFPQGAGLPDTRGATARSPKAAHACHSPLGRSWTRVRSAPVVVTANTCVRPVASRAAVGVAASLRPGSPNSPPGCRSPPGATCGRWPSRAPPGVGENASSRPSAPAAPEGVPVQGEQLQDAVGVGPDGEFGAAGSAEGLPGRPVAVGLLLPGVVDAVGSGGEHLQAPVRRPRRHDPARLRRMDQRPGPRTGARGAGQHHAALGQVDLRKVATPPSGGTPEGYGPTGGRTSARSPGVRRHHRDFIGPPYRGRVRTKARTQGRTARWHGGDSGRGCRWRSRPRSRC